MAGATKKSDTKGPSPLALQTYTLGDDPSGKQGKKQSVSAQQVKQTIMGPGREGGEGEGAQINP